MDVRALFGQRSIANELTESCRKQSKMIDSAS